MLPGPPECEPGPEICRYGAAAGSLPAMPAPHVTVSVTVPAPIAEVWEEAARLENHVEWMADAHSIEFVGEQTRGVGTEISVETRVGPLRTTDHMRFTVWEPPRRMAVEHRGVFQGTGEFLLEPLSETSTVFTWDEAIRFPWWMAGPAGAWVARPVLAAIWRRNLRRFRDRFGAAD